VLRKIKIRLEIMWKRNCMKGSSSIEKKQHWPGWHVPQRLHEQLPLDYSRRNSSQCQG
jgi:hypothetical protein